MSTFGAANRPVLRNSVSIILTETVLPRATCALGVRLIDLMNRYQTPLLNFLLAIIGDYDIAHDRAPGIILVLQGHMTWGPWRRGYRPAIFPSHVVAKETVRINSMYRFVLLPGH